MKKLSGLLLTLCISLAGWAASLNPYAYNLSSTWNEATSELTVRFKLNAHPNMKENSSGRGIQIFAIDPSDNNKQYYIYGVPGDIIKAKMNEYNGGKGDSYDYELTIPITGVTWNGADVLPAGKNLTWAVNVAGLNKDDQASPVVVNDNIANRPYSPHGIAVNNDQNSPDFGSIYVTECTDGVSGNATWGWLSSAKGRSLLKYDPTLKYQTSYRKHKDGDPNSELFSLRNANNLLEPHRVRISDDGRIFVSSYNKNTEAGKPIVWELNKTTGKFTPIIYNNTSYGHRVYGMDVKGSGSGIKILLCILLESTSNSSSKFQVYEYSLNSLGNDKNTGTKLFQYLPGSTNQTVLTNCINNKYYHYIDGLLNVRYGSANRSDVFLGLDFFYNSSVATTLVYYPSGAYGSPKYFNRTGDGHYYGGAGFVPYVDKNTKTERVAMGRCYQRTGKENDGRLQVYEIADIKNKNENATPPYTTTINTRSIVNDIAMDCAHNIYAVSFTDGKTGTDGNGTGRLIAIAMPYSGATLTIAPSSNAEANRLFTLKPVPNILATDLRFAPVPKQPQYRFSFNVNTKPAVAQIRFYKSYGDNGDNDMKKNLAKINADDYQGGNEITPSFVYNIPASQLKQGEISVSLGMCGGKLSGEIGSEDCKITNDSLPRGEWYWSVYVEAPRKSTAFAPIYEQGTTGEDTHKRLHVGINNYPETDGFGHVYAVNYFNELDPQNSLMVYGFNPNGKSNDEQNNIKNAYRYKLIKNYLNPTGEKPKFTNQRRLAVAPDGKVYIADCGSSQPFSKNAIRPWLFNNGGVYVWNPNTQTGNEIQISLFSTKDRTSTATGIDIYNHDGQLKLYATNTYGEFENHLDKGYKWNDYEYNEANQENKSIYGWNGFKEFNLGTPDNILLEETNGTKLYSLGMGDGNGNIGIVATDKGVWMAQHRLNDVQYTIDQFRQGVKNPALPDNTENYILSFVPYGNNNTRTWTSCTTRGINYSGSQYDQKGASELTQLPSSPLQACPGAGLAYRKTTTGKEYLYIVNHEGNIVELQITSWDGTKPFVEYKKTYPTIGPKASFQNTGRLQGVINSMCFDYAGNLITTSGLEYLGSTSEQNIIVYTMPYDRTNAREIQAPNSCRFIPERTAYLEPRSEMELTLQPYVANTTPCYLDIFRPMPNTSFSTICLPFDLDMKQLTTEALKDAEVKRYTGLQLSDIGGEKMLELVFEDIPTVDGKQILEANTPYIIQPKVRIPGIIQLQKPIQFVTINEKSIENATQDNEYAITFKGVIPTQQIKVNQPLTLLLVAENRLAEMIPDEGTTGQIHGFRGYFELNKPLNGIGARIAPKQSVSTSTTIIVDGKRVNIEKYLREGRVYIRMGDTLYTIDGQKVQ